MGPSPPLSCHQIPRFVQSQLNIFLVEAAGRMKEVYLNKVRVEQRLNDQDQVQSMRDDKPGSSWKILLKGTFEWNKNSYTRLLS